MSCGAVAVPMQGAPYNLHKASGNGNCATTPDVALSLGRCLSTSDANNSSYSGGVRNYSIAFKELGADSTTIDNNESGSVTEDDDPKSSPAVAGKSFCSNFSFADGVGLERTGSGISVLSAENNQTPSAQGKEKSCKKLPSSQYKGVVPQPNGRWGAQIYEKHQRVWLGTFNSEEVAARTYDRAAIKFRGPDAITNSNLVDSHQEAVFLGRHSKSEIVDMLRKHTYDEELKQNKTTSDINLDFVGSTFPETPEPREHLFNKTVTPSDVGKLNRIVIPKQFAEKYFSLDVDVDVESGECKRNGVLLNFEDSTYKTWRFRYSFWNSSQSYVLTRGWNRFVKEKRLQAGDIVTFERSCATSISHKHFISFSRRRCRRLCNVLPTAAPSPPLKSFLQSINPFTAARYPQRSKLFNSQLPPIIDPVDNCSIPSPNFLYFMSPESVTGEGNPSSLDFVDLREAPPSTDGNSFVRLFGVNLQPSQLNLFPSFTVVGETEQPTKRKAVTAAALEVFPGMKRLCDV